MSIYAPQTETARHARRYHDAGLCVIPITTDGTRIPIMPWERWEWKALGYHWDCPRPCGIGIVCGAKSGNLEVLDFDAHHAPESVFQQWTSMVDTTLLSRLPIVATPSNGWQVWYRCETIGKPAVIARDEAGHGLVELKSHQSMITAIGSPLEVHHSHRPYELINGDLCAIPAITTAQRQRFLDSARLLNRYKSPSNCDRRRRGNQKCSGANRPGDKFNHEADWRDIMEDAGWTIQRTSGDTTYWTKPLATRGEVHATTNYRGADLLKVFTTDAPPFETDKTYDKFGVYALLHHNGDLSKAAQALAKHPLATV